MARSRLKHHLQQQSFKNIFLAIGGIIALIVLMATFGMDILVNLSLLVKKPLGTEIKKDDLAYIAPPVINPMSEATNSAKIIVSGYAGEKQTVNLYVNGKLADKTTVKKNKQFVFSDIEVEKGSNEIKVRAVAENKKESDYSSITKITYIDKPPTLDITSPQDGQTVTKNNGQIQISGKTDPGVKITVNDFWAIVQDDGTFTYMLSINDGETVIKIEATDDANNKTSKEIKVKT